MLLNTGGWVFDEAEPRYTIGLSSVSRSIGNLGADTRVRLRGPFASLERFQNGVGRPPAEFAGAEVMDWTDTASLPLLPTDESLEIFVQLRKHPRLDLNDARSWRVRPQTELHATNDKGLMDLKSESCPRGFWPVFKGESFDIWEPDTGRYYGFADSAKVVPHLQDKRRRAARNRNSPFCEFDAAWLAKDRMLPCYSPRIAFRDITNRTNQRTVIAALVPPKVFITNAAPYLLWPRGDERDQAFLVGVLSSLCLDWYARRFVETHVNFFILNPFPVPRPPPADRLWQRVVALAGRLAAVDDRYAAWAGAVGVECGPLEAREKLDLICELDAVVAHLYGLEERHLAHIFETFHEKWQPGTSCDHPTLGDYNARLAATLRHFRAWGGRLK